LFARFPILSGILKNTYWTFSKYYNYTKLFFYRNIALTQGSPTHNLYENRNLSKKRERADCITGHSNNTWRVTWQFSIYKKLPFSWLFVVKFSSKIDKTWHVTFWLTPSLPHVLFGDNVATTKPLPPNKKYLKGRLLE
jgi:hypothetical protein